MRKQGHGKIVNIASIGGKMATPIGGWYYASKHAVEGLSDSLRLEAEPFGIDVIIIQPGIIETNWENVAIGNLEKTSENSTYRDMIKAVSKFFKPNGKFTQPVVIAELIKKAIEARHPKARYSKGYMAGITMFGKRWLSDRMFDRILMNQLGIRLRKT